MDPIVVGIVAIVVLLILLFAGLPVAVSMILVGIAGLGIFVGFDKVVFLTGPRVITSVTDYSLAVLPVFLFMGEIADFSGMMTQAYRSANIMLDRVRGGLAMASIFGAAAFSCISGSSMACAAIMGRVALPQLLNHKYDPALATGALAAGGTLGNLIPPGVLLVVYSVLTEASLGKLYIACYLPGLHTDIHPVLDKSQAWSCLGRKQLKAEIWCHCGHIADIDSVRVDLWGNPIRYLHS